MRLLTKLIGITLIYTATLNTIYIYIYIKVGRRGFLLQLVFGLDDQIGLWQFKPHGPNINMTLGSRDTTGNSVIDGN